MTRRTNIAAATFLAGLLLTGMIAAQKPIYPEVQPEATLAPEATSETNTVLPEATIEFDAGSRYQIYGSGITFFVPLALADGTEIIEEPAATIDLNIPPAGQNPANTRYTFSNYPITASAEDKALLLTAPELRVFETADFAEYAFEGDYGFPFELAKLQQLLDERPDLGDANSLPQLPLQAGNQILRAHERYIEFDGGAGILYLTVNALDVSPIIDGQVVAVFQGLSDDGTIYITGSFPILTGDLLPDAIPADLDYNAFSEGYETYLASVTQSIDEQAADLFVPHYEALASLFSSIDLTP